MNLYTIVILDYPSREQVQFSSNEELNQYIQDTAKDYMDEEETDFCKLAVIDWTKMQSFITEVQREITTTFSRTDY